jgi:hypothetical protein
MPKNPPYVPPRDANLSLWAANFSSLLSASPATYGQTAATAAAVAASVATFQAAYGLVTSKATKTADTVTAKNNAKVAMLALVRPVAVNTSLNVAVTSANKIAIGVNPRSSTPSPITPPTTYPILTIQAGAALQLYVRYRDSAASVSVKSKPYGVGAVMLAYAISATPITSPSQLTSLLALTKVPALVQFATGGQCYMAAYYQLLNGKVSGFGPIVSFTVPTAS